MAYPMSLSGVADMTSYSTYGHFAFLCTVGGDFIEPIDQLGVAAASSIRRFNP